MSNKMADRLLGGKERGTALVVSGPAGTGKTTLVSKLVEEFPNVVESISWTTRKARPGEKDGEHYHFVTQEEFDAQVAKEDFLEHVQLFDCAYGTSKSHIEEELDKGNHVVMVIDVQGALQVRERFPAKLIFIKPPSPEALKKRLQLRRTESPEALEKRLNRAIEELKWSDEYDYQIVNDDLEKAYEVFRSIIIAEVHHTEELEE